MAESTKAATAVWKEGLVFEADTAPGFTVRMDSDASSRGFSPMALVLAALAGCTGMDVIDILRKKRQAVTGLEVRVKGARAPEHPRKYTDIHIMYVVTGHEVDAEAVRRSIELSETKYCAVAATLRGGAQISTEFEIHETAQAAGGQRAPSLASS
jgi:putative redox protein